VPKLSEPLFRHEPNDPANRWKGEANADGIFTASVSVSPRNMRAVNTRRVLAFLAFSLALFAAESARADPLRWPQPGGLGTPVGLTYSFSNLLDGRFSPQAAPTELRAATEEAFGLWSRYAPLNFFERPDKGPLPSDESYDAKGSPDIRIGYHRIEDGTILAHAYLPFLVDREGLAGDIHFNSIPSFTWVIGDAFNGFDYLEVITHEIGHAVGVEHILYAEAIMGPWYGHRYHGLGTAFLFPADIRAIRDLYGSGVGSVHGSGVGSVHAVPEPSTVLLVLTGILWGPLTRLQRARLEQRAPPRAGSRC
jgi:hypothetical protein